MKRKLFKFDLIENAKDSLRHAIEHLTNIDGVQAGDLKRSIRDVAHVIELLLKERLRRIHPAFIWQNIDKYPSSMANTVSTVGAVERLLKLAGISLNEDSKKTITSCKKLRDNIEHYEFELDLKEVKAIIGRMLSFIFDFSKCHLNLDLEQEFRDDETWKELIEIYEFWEAHSKVLEKQLSSQNIPVCDCPSCGAGTFNVSDGECALCSHHEEQIECEGCKNLVWESEAETFGGLDGDEDTGVYEYSITLCKSCIEAEAEASYAYDIYCNEDR